MNCKSFPQINKNRNFYDHVPRELEKCSGKGTPWLPKTIDNIHTVYKKKG